jgi:hypothetical protein
LLLLCATAGQCQIIQFDGEGFKNQLLSANANIDRAGAGWAQVNFPYNSTGFWSIANVSIDTNNNGEIEVSEAQQITSLWFGGQTSITNLVGLEHFVNLKLLNISGSISITAFNFPTLSQLEVLFCFNTGITSLNLAPYPLLNDLYVMNNGMTSLDFSANPLMRLLQCRDNQLTTLDLSNNPNMIYLHMKNNNISTLNIKNGAQQSFTGNVYMLPDAWANNPLTAICLDGSELQNVQSHLTSNNYNLNNIVFDTSNNCVLSNATFEKKALLVAPNPSKGIFELQLPQATRAKVQVFSLLGQMVYETTTHEWSKLQLNLTNQSSGVYLLKVITDYGLIYQEKLVVN